jgi:transcriptional regulator with XRE-family HTH domain
MESVMKTVSLKDKIASLPKARQEAIQQRAAEIELEIMTLKKLREAQEITQEELADQLGITQASVSRLEKRSDMLISTLNEVITKLGGELVVTAKFRNMVPVRVDLADGLLRPSRELTTENKRVAATGTTKKGRRRTKVEAQSGALVMKKKVVQKALAKASASRARKPSMAPRSHGRSRHIQEA